MTNPTPGRLMRAEDVAKLAWLRTNPGTDTKFLLDLLDEAVAQRAAISSALLDPSEEDVATIMRASCHPTLCDFPECKRAHPSTAGSAQCWGRYSKRVVAGLRAVGVKITGIKD